MESPALVFGLSFLTGLTGALIPGPLLTYTIVKTLDTPGRGWLTGPKVIAGHAVLELALVIALLLGLSALFTSLVTKRVVGFAGALFLIFLACLILRDVILKKAMLPAPGEGKERAGQIRNPYLAGVLISASAPAWWGWWATTGLVFMTGRLISLHNVPSLIAFFTGHVLADLAWYTFISLGVHNLRRILNDVVYRVILCVASGFLIVFAIFLLVRTLLDLGA